METQRHGRLLDVMPWNQYAFLGENLVGSAQFFFKWRAWKQNFGSRAELGLCSYGNAHPGKAQSSDRVSPQAALNAKP